MSEVTAEVPAINRCRIEEVFAGPFIELIGLAPRNPVVRGLILAQTGKMPEAERATFEQIRDWVETTCERKRPASAPRSPAGIVITVEFSETEYGRANYSVGCSGSDEFVLSEDELLELVEKAQDDGEGLEGAVSQIAAKINDDAWHRCDPSLDDYGDYEYEDHNSTDSENSSIEFSRTQVRDRLRLFLQSRHPDLLEALA